MVGVRITAWFSGSQEFQPVPLPSGANGDANSGGRELPIPDLPQVESGERISGNLDGGGLNVPIADNTLMYMCRVGAAVGGTLSARRPFRAELAASKKIYYLCEQNTMFAHLRIKAHRASANGRRLACDL